MVPMFSVLAPRISIHGKPHAPDFVQRIEQLFDRRFAQFGISRVRHAAVRDDFETQRAFRPERQLVLGRFAVDDELRTPRVLRRRERARTVALLAHHEQQPDVALPGFEQLAHREDHGRDDALGIAGAASPNVLVILARRKERRHGVHVRGERDRWLAPPGEYVIAPRLHWHQLNAPVELLRQLRQMREERVAHLFFVFGDGFDVHQRARQFKNIHHFYADGGRKDTRAAGVLPSSAPPDLIADPDDSGQVLAWPPNRAGRKCRGRFRRMYCKTPFTGAPNSRNRAPATDGLRSSTRTNSE